MFTAHVCSRVHSLTKQDKRNTSAKRGVDKSEYSSSARKEEEEGQVEEQTGGGGGVAVEGGTGGGGVVGGCGLSGLSWLLLQLNVSSPNTPEPSCCLIGGQVPPRHAHKFKQKQIL